MIKPVVLSLLSTLVFAACGATPSASSTPGQSPGPSPSPGQSPSPGASPSPGQSPSPTDPTPAPSPQNSPRTGGISHPTGADEIVLQYEVAGGFVPVDFVSTQAPQFTLYGDGTVIWRPQEDPERVGDPGGGLPRFLQGQMDEDGVQALLAFALGQGRLVGARENYPQNSCADCPQTVFRVNADGMSKTVTVDALGVEEQVDQADRTGFQLLAEWLNNFDEQARNGIAGDVVFYDPSLYRVVLTEATAEMGEFGGWPWEHVTIDDFGPRGEGGWQREAVLTREQVAEVAEIPSGGEMGILVEDPEGGMWSVAVRPLLPDEMAALDR